MFEYGARLDSSVVFSPGRRKASDRYQQANETFTLKIIK
jgi:hypothetical protein